MAAIDTYGGGVLIPDLTPVLQIMQQEKPTLLSAINLNGSKRAISTEHKWHSLTLEPIETTLNGAVTAGDATITVTDGTVFSDGDVIMIKDRLSEQFKVTVATHVLTLLEMDGTPINTTYSHDSLETVVRISHPTKEGQEGAGSAVDYAAKLTNYTQIFKDGLELSGTELVSILEETNQALEPYFIKQKMDQIYRDMNNSVLFGLPYIGTTALPRGSAGLKWWLTDTTYGTPINTNLGGADLTLKAINDLTARMINMGGNANMLACNVNTARKITALANALGSTLITLSRGETIAGNMITALQGDFLGSGLKTILIDESISDGTLFMLTTADLAFIPYKNRVMQMEQLAKTGDLQKYMLVGEYTLEIQNPYNNHAMLFNFLTTGI